ncbi:predicted protein [Chaetomium globosum CBS 148.51]|uniref:Uncharacterized protein n=1 Tax=Chaetomium globosum (strain ATCC 6205 / CBS 148.51 / DSM 1962 / NBRC 6347 / NRRL 1970) TaxID=306901 RepID=Q2GSI9_CHAGB|nr:uncharacterized protein CHGG_09065 [Chaetomium globosum CBS 148.51]EAQ85051.1 predicted protein [Chaetomium globosum CBS 148.51]
MGAADWWFRSQTLDMLSSLCANVQELAARGDVVYKILIWDAPGSLMGLKHVTLVQARSRRALDLTVLSQVATTAPNLPTVKFHPVRHTSVFDPPVSLPSMAKLVKLNLPDAYVCHEALLFRPWNPSNTNAPATKLPCFKCHNFQHFSYAQAAEYGPDLEFTPSKAERALVRSTPNLTSLTLYMGQSKHCLRRADVLQSLAGLSKLEDLSLTLLCL